MYTIFPIFCSSLVSAIILGSYFICSISLWEILILFLSVCLMMSLFVESEAKVYCQYDEIMTEEWFKTFVLGEFFLFLSLMVPLFYCNDDLGDEALSDPLGIPLLGIYVLLLSSFCVSNYEHAVEAHFGKFSESLNFNSTFNSNASAWLLLTIINGLGFLFLQYNEFINCPPSVVNSSWYGSCLILVTFHGFHVVVGLLFLCYNYYLLFFLNSNISLEVYLDQYRLVYFTCFYWHFVDFIWFIVYFIVYYLP
uniref:Cytochrome c oxidase subunit 3 n=1 Tax=Polylabris halichoeres TaxID=1004784 RepID=G3F9Y3_POLHA|nr:cytochrome c oxidase subunit III [Polylabris halichoeres]AEB55005.1 cytochrome c oxidase subunit III [Polylabris halichoeres]